MSILVEHPAWLCIILLAFWLIQIALFVFAVIFKKEYLWGILYAFIVSCLVFANWFVSDSNDLAALVIGVTSCGISCLVLIASLITRTALIPYMKKWPLCVGLWVVFFVVAHLIFQKSILLW